MAKKTKATANKPVVSALDTQVAGNHYKTMKIQPVEFIYHNNLPFMEGSIIKYVARHANKNGVADLLKARHFIDLLLEIHYGKKPQ